MLLGSPSAAAPTISPAGPLHFGAPFTVTPTTAWPVCDAPFAVTGTTTVRAFAEKAGMEPSATVTSTFTRRPITRAVDAGTWSPCAVTTIADQHLVANRLTPAPGDFPFLLRGVQVAFFTEHAGKAIRLAVYADADGDWANGAKLLATLDTTVLDNGAPLRPAGPAARPRARAPAAGPPGSGRSPPRDVVPRAACPIGAGWARPTPHGGAWRRRPWGGAPQPGRVLVGRVAAAQPRVRRSIDLRTASRERSGEEEA